jgi:MoxR-like ATPase
MSQSDEATTSQNLYRCTPRQVRGYIIDCLYAGLVPYVQSSPGMGKSMIMKSVANELDLKMIDHRLSTSAPEDLSGLPRFDEQGRAVFAPFADLFPTEHMMVPAGKQGWMLFLDEFPSATKSVQAAAYKLILDKMVGQYNLHPQLVITAAGNLSTDRAITNPISTAMQSRVIHLEMEISHEEWLYDVALTEHYDSRIIAYLSQYPGKLMDFRPDHNEKTFCCPRTWEFVNRLIKGKELTDGHAALLAGTITSGVAVDFIQFTRVFQHMINVAEIMKNPEGCRMPQDTPTKWATISHMMENLNELNFDMLATYANRFSLDFRILFFRSIMIRQPQLRQHPAFAKAMTELSRYLHG